MRNELRERCENIERTYEFLLAYAAQGLSSDQGSPSGGQLRELLNSTAAALDGLGSIFLGVAGQGALGPADVVQEFGRILERDARDALAAVRLVAAQKIISSQLVDNLNASIHLRSLLTDLFLVDELLSVTRGEAGT